MERFTSSNSARIGKRTRIPKSCGSKRCPQGAQPLLLAIETVHASVDAVLGDENISMVIESHAVWRGDNSHLPFIRRHTVATNAGTCISTKFRRDLAGLIQNRDSAIQF